MSPLVRLNVVFVRAEMVRHRYTGVDGQHFDRLRGTFRQFVTVQC